MVEFRDWPEPRPSGESRQILHKATGEVVVREIPPGKELVIVQDKISTKLFFRYQGAKK
jgi:protein required for attachment to host cells